MQRVFSTYLARFKSVVQHFWFLPKKKTFFSFWLSTSVSWVLCCIFQVNVTFFSLKWPWICASLMLSVTLVCWFCVWLLEFMALKELPVKIQPAFSSPSTRNCSSTPKYNTLKERWFVPFLLVQFSKHTGGEQRRTKQHWLQSSTTYVASIC